MEFLTVAGQVFILFILIAVGVIGAKTKILNATITKGLTDIVLYIVTPCVLVKSFVEIPFSSQKLTELLMVLFITFLIHAGSILLATLLVRDADDSRQRMLRFAMIFSNAGFMGLPLQAALLQEEGTFFGGAYIAVFNIVAWTYGLFLMSGNKKDISPKKAFLSPGVLGVLAGLILFLIPLVVSGFHLPEVVFAPIKHLASLNTPVPMIVIGFYLADIDIKAALRDLKSFWVILLRLVVVPLSALGILYLCGIRGTMLISLVISAAAPTAAFTTMFATKYNRYPETSCNIVSLSTLLSILTMPLIVGLASVIA